MKFPCPHCGQKLQADERIMGKVVSCPNCRGSISVITDEAETEPEAKPSSRKTVTKGSVKRKRGASSAAVSTKRTPRRKTGQTWRHIDSTNVSMLGSLGIGLLLAAGFAFLALPMRRTYFGALFWDRGWVPFVLLVLMGWSIGILVLKYRKLKRQKQAMLLDVLPADIGEEITVENVDDFIDRVKNLPSHLHESFMVRRMQLGLRHFTVRHSNPEVASLLVSQSQIDAEAVSSSYSLLKIFIWAIPILGFIGTVIGISSAVSGFSGSLDAAQSMDVLKASLNDVTGGLAVAFDTTLLALVMSLLISIPASAMQKAEEDLLGRIDEYCNEHLLKRINDAGGVSDVASHTAAIMDVIGESLAGNQQEVLEEFRTVQKDMALVQSEQVKVVGDLASAVDGQIEAMEKRAVDHQRSIEENLEKVVVPLESGMKELLEKAEAVEGKTGERLESSARSFKEQLGVVTEGLESLNKVLKELGGKQVVIQKEEPKRRFRLFRGK